MSVSLEILTDLESDHRWGYGDCVQRDNLGRLGSAGVEYRM